MMAGLEFLIFVDRVVWPGSLLPLPGDIIHKDMMLAAACLTRTLCVS